MYVRGCFTLQLIYGSKMRKLEFVDWIRIRNSASSVGVLVGIGSVGGSGSGLGLGSFRFPTSQMC